jgi:hypothetical protein
MSSAVAYRMFSLVFSATILIAITYLGIAGLVDRRDM